MAARPAMAAFCVGKAPAFPDLVADVPVDGGAEADVLPAVEDSLFPVLSLEVLVEGGAVCEGDGDAEAGSFSRPAVNVITHGLLTKSYVCGALSPLSTLAIVLGLSRYLCVAPFPLHVAMLDNPRWQWRLTSLYPSQHQQALLEGDKTDTDSAR